MKRYIDLNADVGEGFGIYTMGDDQTVFQYISSANIACGMHAGDPQVMARTIALSQAAGVASGAHPGFPDLIGFGRRPLPLTEEEIKNCVIYQIGALQAMTAVAGIALSHVKLHGALYNMAAKDYGLSLAIAEGVAAINRDIIFIGLAGSEMIRAGKSAGLKVANEVFADRGYAADGTLLQRGQPGALIEDPAEAVRRVLFMIQNGAVQTQDGTYVALQADTVCLHGDSPRAVETARLLKYELLAAGLAVSPLASFI